MKTIPDVPTKEEIDKILQQALIDDFDYLVLQGLKTTGRRWGEFYGVLKDKTWNYGVQVKDIDFDHKTMDTYVLKRKQYKKKQAILKDPFYSLLRGYVMKNKLGLDNYIFRKRSYREMQRRIKKYVKLAEIEKNITLHSFRHYFITHLRRKGWGNEDIAKLTGHTTPSVIGNYDHTTVADIEIKAREDLEDL